MARFSGLLFIALSMVLLPVASSSSTQCRKCDIDSEGLLNDHLIGQYVYEQGPSGKFYRERVANVSVYPPAIYRQILDGSYAWEDASHFYSESSMNEIVADAGGGPAPYQETTADEREKAAWLTTCVAFRAALKDENYVVALFMGNSCCRSSTGKKYGVPRDICPITE